MATSARYEYHDFEPAMASFLDDVVAGLSAPRKALPPKYFYDAQGSRLFDAICELPEYYPTRTELGMLEACASEIAARIGPKAAIVEYGSGSGRKTAILMRAVQPLAYVAIDISGEQLRTAVSGLASAFPEVRMVAHVRRLHSQAAARASWTHSTPAAAWSIFPGSTIGNFTVPEALAFLRNVREVAGARGCHARRRRPEERSRACCTRRTTMRKASPPLSISTCSTGSTASCKATSISTPSSTARITTRRPGGSKCISSARATRWSPLRAAVLHSQRRNHTYREFLWYSVDEFQALARQAGFEPMHYWVDNEGLFSIHYLTVPG